MNTHPTHMQVGGWGLWPMLVHIGVGLLFRFVFCVIVAYIVVVVVVVIVVVIVVVVFW